MPNPTISIIIGTKGRPSLAAAILSVAPQIDENDEILIITEGERQIVLDIVTSFKSLGINIKYIIGPTTSAWGYPQRTLGFELATKDRIVILNDDDKLEVGAIKAIKKIVQDHPTDLIIGWLRDARDGAIVGNKYLLEEGHLADTMLILPNDKTKIGQYNLKDERDIIFALSTLKYYPQGPVWLEQVIYEWNTYSARNDKVPK